MDVILTEQQVQQLRQADGQTVRLFDQAGALVARIAPEGNEAFLAELKRRAASPGPRYTSEQVRSRLQALQREWDRVGAFDDAYMRDFLKKLDETDPASCTPHEG